MTGARARHKYRIWYREGRPQWECGPWTGYAESPEDAGEKMIEWFRECGNCGDIEITRTQLVEEQPAEPYDAAAHLRSLRWIGV